MWDWRHLSKIFLGWRGTKHLNIPNPCVVVADSMRMMQMMITGARHTKHTLYIIYVSGDIQKRTYIYIVGGGDARESVVAIECVVVGK